MENDSWNAPYEDMNKLLDHLPKGLEFKYENEGALKQWELNGWLMSFGLFNYICLDGCSSKRQEDIISCLYHGLNDPLRQWETCLNREKEDISHKRLLGVMRSVLSLACSQKKLGVQAYNNALYQFSDDYRFISETDDILNNWLNGLRHYALGRARLHNEREYHKAEEDFTSAWKYWTGEEPHKGFDGASTETDSLNNMTRKSETEWSRFLEPPVIGDDNIDWYRQPIISDFHKLFMTLVDRESASVYLLKGDFSTTSYYLKRARFFADRIQFSDRFDTNRIVLSLNALRYAISVKESSMLDVESLFETAMNYREEEVMAAFKQVLASLHQFGDCHFDSSKINFDQHWIDNYRKNFQSSRLIAMLLPKDQRISTDELQIIVNNFGNIKEDALRILNNNKVFISQLNQINEEDWSEWDILMQNLIDTLIRYSKKYPTKSLEITKMIDQLMQIFSTFNTKGVEIQDRMPLTHRLIGLFKRFCR